VDALSKNPVGSATDDDDFGEEVQDIPGTQADAPEEEKELLFVQSGKRQNGWVSGGRIEGLFSMMPVVLVSITGHVLDAISCICLMLHEKKTHLSSLFQMKRQCQWATDLRNTGKCDQY
jgi:hypothetical protein